MSVINQMLRDLDARQASPQERAGLPPRLRTLPATTVSRPHTWRILLIGMSVGALIAGGVVSLFMAPAPTPAGPPAAPVAAPVAVPPAPTIAGAPVPAAPPHPTVDPAEMKLSTLLAGAPMATIPAPPEPANAKPALAPPATPKSAPTTGKATRAEPLKPTPAEPPKPMPAAPLKPTAPESAKPETAKPEIAKPEPAPPAVKPAPPPIETTPAEAQIDRRAKGGQARESAEAEYRKGMLAVKRGDNAAAQPLLQHALELDPLLAKARQALLSVLVGGRHWSEARQTAQNGLALDPAQTGWAIILARLQFEQGDAAAAIETLGRHAAHAGNDADYQGLFAYLLQKQQRPAEAAQRFQAALALRPNEGRWWFGLGLSLETAGRADEAKQAYAKAREVGNLPADMTAVIEQKLK